MNWNAKKSADTYRDGSLPIVVAFVFYLSFYSSIGYRLLCRRRKKRRRVFVSIVAFSRGFEAALPAPQRPVMDTYSSGEELVIKVIIVDGL